MRDKLSDCVCIAGITALVCVLGYGYGNNIWQIAMAHEFSPAVLVRLCGVFVSPLGIVMGYL